MQAIQTIRKRKFAETKPFFKRRDHRYTAMQQYITGTMSEAVVSTVTLAGLIIARLVFMDGSDEESVMAMRWFLLPLLGSMVASCGAILLNPNPEDKRVVVGRSIFSMAMGTAIPKVASLIISKDTWPWLAGVYVDPAVIFMMGFFIATAVYILSRPFVQKFYDKSDGISDELHNDFHDRIFKNRKKNQDEDESQQ